MKNFSKTKALEMANTWVEKVLDEEQTYSYDKLGAIYNLTYRQVNMVIDIIDKVIDNHEKVYTITGYLYDGETNYSTDEYGYVPCSAVVYNDDENLVYKEDGGCEFVNDLADQRTALREIAFAERYEERLTNNKFTL